MRWLLCIFLIGCVNNVTPTSLDGSFVCGPKTCGTGQVCVTESSGSQCDVNADAGIGQYQTFSWDCVELPAACDGVTSCACISGGGAFCTVSAEGREVDTGCI